MAGIDEEQEGTQLEKSEQEPPVQPQENQPQMTSEENPEKENIGFVEGFTTGIKTNLTALAVKGAGVLYDKAKSKLADSSRVLSQEDKEYLLSTIPEEEQSSYDWCQTEEDFYSVTERIMREKELDEKVDSMGFSGWLGYISGSILDPIALAIAPTAWTAKAYQFLLKPLEWISPAVAKGVIGKAAASGVTFGATHGTLKYAADPRTEATDAAAIAIADSALCIGFSVAGDKAAKYITKYRKPLADWFRLHCPIETYALKGKEIISSMGQTIATKLNASNISSEIKVNPMIANLIKGFNPIVKGKFSPFSSINRATDFFYNHSIESPNKIISAEQFYWTISNESSLFNADLTKIAVKHKMKPDELSRDIAIALRNDLQMLPPSVVEGKNLYLNLRDKFIDQCVQYGIFLEDPRFIPSDFPSIRGQLLMLPTELPDLFRDGRWYASKGYFPRLYDLKAIKENRGRFERIIADSFQTALFMRRKNAEEYAGQITSNFLSQYDTANAVLEPLAMAMSGKKSQFLNPRIIPASDAILNDFLVSDVRSAINMQIGDIGKKLAFVQALDHSGMLDPLVEMVTAKYFPQEKMLWEKFSKKNPIKVPGNYKEIIDKIIPELDVKMMRLLNFAENNPNAPFSNPGDQELLRRAIINSIVNTTPNDIFKLQLANEFTTKQFAIRESETLSKAAKTKALEQLDKELETGHKLLDYNQKIYWGTFNQAWYEPKLQKAYNSIAAFNCMRQLGMVTLSSLSDIALLQLQYGMKKTYRAFTQSIIARAKNNIKIDPRAVIRNKEDAKRLGGAISESLENGMTRFMYELQEQNNRVTPPAWITTASNKFSKLTGLALFDDTLKRAAFTLVSGDIMKAVEANNTQQLKKWGINDKALALFRSELRHVEWDETGNAILNAEKWSEEARDLFHTIAMGKVRTISIYPSKGDIPIWIQDTPVKYLLQYHQFKSSLFTNLITPLLNKQFPAPNVWTFLFTFYGIEVIANYMKSVLSGDPYDIKDPSLYASTLEGLPYIGGFMFMSSSVYDAIECYNRDQERGRKTKLMRPARATFGQEFASRFPVGSFLMDSYDIGRTLANKAYNPAHPISEREWRTMKGMVPFNNIIFLNGLGNHIIRRHVEKSGGKLRKTRKELYEERKK